MRKMLPLSSGVVYMKVMVLPMKKKVRQRKISTVHICHVSIALCSDFSII